MMGSGISEEKMQIPDIPQVLKSGRIDDFKISELDHDEL